ncbi:helix-turn-helix transcriptional regulator [Rhizobium sp. P40RR-XXII]|uniref:AraC family transcriptional regulator n=1 Tax=Rhizobium sp. P40RR-XXII TaxID=2726739 RepID=UPI0014573562|nr:AraC family transcriptional regulator [Rhizobium sp. P40RR-XXII]NLS20737.1 helix-turn-helix transcriptional regulator [Rhizobium sp. P40RR-XXII]
MTANDDEADFLTKIVKLDSWTGSWNGVTIDERRERLQGKVLHELVREDETGLTINLDEVGGFTEPRLKRDQACPIDHRPNHMALIPKGMRLWGYGDLDYCHYAVLRFDIPTLDRTFGEEFTARAFESPRIRFMDNRILTLVRMLLDVPRVDQSSNLLGESLTAAIFAILSAGDTEVREAGKLARWQVKRVTEYMREQLPRQIELSELAGILNQSQWHFCRAFKASTGLSPYQWQLEQRIKLAKELLLDTEIALDAVAEATGFADAMHLNRAFKRRAGKTPGAWRRSQR